MHNKLDFGYEGIWNAQKQKLIVLHSKGCNIYKGEKKRIGQARER